MLKAEDITVLLEIAAKIHDPKTNPGFRQTFTMGNLLIGIIPNANKLTMESDPTPIVELKDSGKVNKVGMEFLEELRIALALKPMASSESGFDVVDSVDNGYIVVELEKIQLHIDIIHNDAEIVATALHNATVNVDPSEFIYELADGKIIKASIKENRALLLENVEGSNDDIDTTELVQDLDFHISAIFEATVNDVLYRTNGLTLLIDNHEINVEIS